MFPSPELRLTTPVRPLNVDPATLPLNTSEPPPVILTVELLPSRLAILVVESSTVTVPPRKVIDPMFVFIVDAPVKVVPFPKPKLNVGKKVGLNPDMLGPL